MELGGEAQGEEREDEDAARGAAEVVEAEDEAAAEEEQGRGGRLCVSGAWGRGCALGVPTVHAGVREPRGPARRQLLRARLPLRGFSGTKPNIMKPRSSRRNVVETFHVVTTSVNTMERTESHVGSRVAKST